MVTILIMVPFNMAFAQTNETTTTVVPPNIIYPQQQPTTAYPTSSGFDIASILGIVGAAIAYLNSKQGDKKAADEREKLKDELDQKDRELKETQQGALMIAQVANKLAQSLKDTDYGDQDFARIFYTMINQLSKLDVIKPVLTEKIKTNDTDLLINNKSIIEIATEHLEQMLRDNNEYYSKMGPTLNDTCENRIIRSVSLADKMTTKGD
jgi:hypothetical protein